MVTMRRLARDFWKFGFLMLVVTAFGYIAHFWLELFLWGWRHGG